MLIANANWIFLVATALCPPAPASHPTQVARPYATVHVAPAPTHLVPPPVFYRAERRRPPAWAKRYRYHRPQGWEHAGHYARPHAPPPVSISGRVMAPNGAPATGVVVTLAGTAEATAVTDAYGNYSFVGLPAGSYAVRPSRPGCSFAPDVVNLNNLASGIAQDFNVACHPRPYYRAQLEVVPQF